VSGTNANRGLVPYWGRAEATTSNPAGAKMQKTEYRKQMTGKYIRK